VLLSDRILFVDAEAIVIDKPAGLPVDRPSRGGDSVVGRLDELKLGFQRSPTPIHRLDQDTSGCLLLARNPKAASRFGLAFEGGAVDKTYLALVDGELDQSEGLVDLPLRKISSAERGWRMVGDPSGQPAQTSWRQLASKDGRTLVEFRPATGRTHQLRVHAREGLGAPIVGDPVYGVGPGPMMLHAVRLVVPRERKPAIDAAAPLPPHFADWADAT
jgi:tRNA pseudouridine32 synthase / 23S rRNA pseudouridine746 synthase